MKPLYHQNPILLAILVVLVTLCYLPGLHGPFLLDDLPNILQNPAIQIRDLSPEQLLIAFNGNESGPLGRKIPALTFAIDFLIGNQAFVPLVFKATNLLIHALAACFLFLASRELLRQTTLCKTWTETQRQLGAFAGSALWALHPLQATPVLYVVQRMASLSGLFVFAGFYLYLLARRRLATSPRPTAWLHLVLAYLVAMGLGAISKEPALLFPYLVLAAELTLLDWSGFSSAVSGRLRWWLAATALLPALGGIAYLLYDPALVLNGYQARPFTLPQRLLTEPRVLWFYVGLFAFPYIRQFSLFHDDFPVSTTILSPWTTAPAVIAWVMLFVVAVRWRRRLPVLSFCVLWFLFAHGMESTLFPLELVFEHRNYVASAAFCMAAILWMVPLARRLENRLPLAALSLIVLATVGFVSYTRAGIWSDSQTLAHFTLRNHPDSLRAHLNEALTRFEAGDQTLAVYEPIRASAAIASDAMPVLEMWRQLNRMSHEMNTPSETGPTTDPEPQPLPTTYLAQPVMEKHHLSALTQLVAEELSRRLATNPASSGLLNSFQHAVTCVLNDEPRCRGTEDQLVRWLQMSLDQGGFDQLGYAQLQLMLAKLEVRQGDIESGFKRLDLAIAATPGKGLYLKEKATLYAAIGDYDNADKMIDLILTTPGLLSFEYYNAKLLKEQLHLVGQDSTAPKAKQPSGDLP